MDRAFQNSEEVIQFLREYLEGEAEGLPDGDRPTYIDEVEVDIDTIHANLYEHVSELKKGVESMTVSDCDSLMQQIMLRDAIWFQSYQ